MDEFTIAIAGLPIRICSRFSSTRVYFSKYLTDAEAACAFCAEDWELLQEQALLDAEADQEGLRRRRFTEPFLERSVFQRKTAQVLAARSILLLHGSTVAVDGYAYLFTADCGVGKSTHTRLWREHFGTAAQMVNDDRAFLELTESGVIAHGSPWSGKHGLDTNMHAPLAGICILERGSENRITPLPPVEALPLLYKQVFQPEPFCEDSLRLLTQTLTHAAPLWHMTCTKSSEAAEAAYEAMHPAHP